MEYRTECLELQFSLLQQVHDAGDKDDKEGCVSEKQKRGVDREKPARAQSCCVWFLRTGFNEKGDKRQKWYQRQCEGPQSASVVSIKHNPVAGYQGPGQE